MTPEEELQSRLIRLKRMIIKSKNVKAEIKYAFENTTIDNFETKGFSNNKAEVFSLYRLRNDLLIKEGVYSEAYAAVLNNLSKVDDSSQVYLTALTIDNKLYLIFSDNDYENCFGIIFKDW